VDETTQHKLIWGWLRFFLGYTQMSLAVVALGALVTVGVRPITWAFAIGATAATIVSRLIYHGRQDPNLAIPKKQKNSGLT
jgi:hypothetical protein